MARSPSIFFWILALAALPSCGGGRSEADLHAAFARIQVDEARIENARADAAEGCDSLAAACAETCSARGDLCAAASPTEDRDALTRCERAGARCDACLASHEAECSGAGAATADGREGP
jgi:hypothetical protein